MGTFFFSFCHFTFFWVILIFSYKKKKKEERGNKKEIAAARLATISATRWTGNKLFLRVALANWPEPCFIRCFEEYIGVGIPKVSVCLTLPEPCCVIMHLEELQEGFSELQDRSNKIKNQYTGFPQRLENESGHGQKTMVHKQKWQKLLEFCNRSWNFTSLTHEF